MPLAEEALASTFFCFPKHFYSFEEYQYVPVDGSKDEQINIRDHKITMSAVEVNMLKLAKKSSYSVLTLTVIDI